MIRMLVSGSPQAGWSAYPPRLSVKADIPIRQPSANWRPEQVQQNPTPHAIAVYASQPLSPVATQHPGGPLRPYLGRTCTGWIAPALPGAFHLFNNLVGGVQQAQRNVEAKRI